MSEFRSPFRRANSIISVNSSATWTGEGKNRRRAEIENLLNKFVELSSNIEVEACQTNLNLIQYERENEKIKYDPQMIIAKLRKLENRAELKRAQMEIDNRSNKKKRKRPSQQKYGQSYSQIYEEFLKNRKLTSDCTQFSDGESVDESSDNKNIAYFEQLKRLPRFLQFTMTKMESKQKQIEQKSKQRQKQIEEHQKNRNVCSDQYLELMQEVENERSVSMTYNPESKLEAQRSRLLSKKKTGNISKEVQALPRCHKMIQRQSKILQEIDQKSLSKENVKRLKNRLSEVIVSLQKSERGRRQVALPKIQTTR